MKKKVLFVILSLYNGGAERSLVNLLNELPADKYDIDLMLFKRGGMFEKQVPGFVNIIDAPIELTRLYGPTKKSGKQAITKLVGTAVCRMKEKTFGEQKAYRWQNFYSKCIPNIEKHYDVAVSYTTGEAMYFVMSKVDAEKKYAFVHNDYKSAKHPEKYDREYFKLLDGIVTISNHCLEILNEVFPEYCEKSYYFENITSSIVIRNRANEFFPEEFKDADNRIVSVGRLNRQKGFDIAIEAAQILKERGCNFCWYIVGDGPEKSNLEELVANKGVEDCFKLIGPRENPYAYMNGCSIFAQTSRYEGKSMVLDEAKIIGVPILVTNYPTVYDQIADGLEGHIVELEPSKIADGIQLLLNDENKRESFVHYLRGNEYGNQDEVSSYIELLDR